MSTASSREQVVEELHFEEITDQEVLRTLELANAGHYSLEDMPDNWQKCFDAIGQELSETR